MQRDPETYDLLTVVMVALPKPGCYNEEARFTETMATLLSPSTSAQSKARALEQSMGPSISLGLREELDAMTSLGEWAIEIGMERGLEQGLEQGRASGIEQATLNSLHSLMRTMHLDALSAMDALEIPADQRPHYLELLLAS